MAMMTVVRTGLYKDDDESLVDGEPPAKKSRLAEPGNNRTPLISKLTKTLQLTEHVIDGILHP